MTSRTTKQAARAYQKAHGVPYTEALRQVMDSSQGPRDHAVPDARSNPRSSAGHGYGFTAAVEDGPVGNPDEMAFLLGIGSMSPMGFPAITAPIWWSPKDEALLDRAATLGVYGPQSGGKSDYLAALVRTHLVGIRTLVVASDPQNYPPQEGLEFMDLGLVEEAYRGGDTNESPHDLSAALIERINEAVADGVQVIVHDVAPEALRDTPLRWLLRVARSLGVVVLFSSLDCQRNGDDWTLVPGNALPGSTVTVMLNPKMLPLAGSGRSFDPERPWMQRLGFQRIPLLRPDDPFATR